MGKCMGMEQDRSAPARNRMVYWRCSMTSQVVNPTNLCKIPSSTQCKVMITKQSLIAACEQQHWYLEWEMLIIEDLMRNIVATLIYSDNSYTNVFDYHEGLCRTIQWWRLCIKSTFACCWGILREVGREWVKRSVSAPPGETYPPAHPPPKHTPPPSTTPHQNGIMLESQSAPVP